jgi:hypothetical protein
VSQEESDPNGISALRARCEAAERERDHLRRDLCEIAVGCGIGCPDKSEAKRRIISIRHERDIAKTEATRLMKYLVEISEIPNDHLHDVLDAVRIASAAIAETKT